MKKANKQPAELLEPIEIEVEKYTEEQYREMLNEEGDVKVCGMTFSPSRILEELDPTAFRCGFNDFQEYETKYECPICKEQHDDEEDAKFCCQERPAEEEERFDKNNESPYGHE